MAEHAGPLPIGGLRRRLVTRLGRLLFQRLLPAAFGRASRIPTDPLLDAELFPWVEEIRSHWSEIRAELDVQLRHRAELPSFQEISPDQYRISPDHRWKTFVFYGFGVRSDLPCQLCPRTAELLERVPGIQSAFFSILAPHKHIPLHQGVTRGLVRCHLGLVVPRGPERCEMEVGGEIFRWAEGGVCFFDDTYPHQVWNDTNEERAVLLFDFERPMKPWGRWLHHLTVALLKRSGYFRDAQRNQEGWAARYRDVIQGSASPDGAGAREAGRAAIE